ncbi:MAG TPA: ATP-binding protein [Syntrophorhabdales bacterium]|nr:ATP-binding protein [Syntrophorhabdales bacterium]
MGEKDYKKLWWKIVFAILGFSLIPLFALGIAIYYQFSVSYTAKIIEDLKTLVENRRSAIDLFFDERISQLVTLAHTHSLSLLTDETNLNVMFNTMQTRSKSFIDIGVIDWKGNHVAYVGPYPELKGVNYKNEEWFQSVLSRGVYISDVFMGFRKFPHFIIAVASRQGDKTWILRATINSDIIDRLVGAAQMGKRGDAFIINKDNMLQTAPRFSGDLLGRPKAPDFSKTVETSVEEIASGSEHSFFSASVINNTRWILVVKEEFGEQLTPLLRARSIAVALCLVGILVIVVGTVLTTRSLMKELIRVDREKAVSDDMVIQSSKMAALGKMAAGIAHEINNPLAVIGEKVGWIRDLLTEEDLGHSTNLKEIDDAARSVQAQVERARKVTHRFLGFARRMEPVREQVDVNRTLNDTVELLGNESRYRNIDIQMELDPNLPRLLSDASQLQQVFINIINNAIDAIDGVIDPSRRGGKIQIRTALLSKTNEILIEISDDGPGISKENIGKIFDPFFTTKEVGKGTGLGLSIVYSIIEKLGGRVTVASKNGKGTTFAISFPVM